MKKTLTHTTWECKYHVVWVPKNRRKIIEGTASIHFEQFPNIEDNI